MKTSAWLLPTLLALALALPALGDGDDGQGFDSVPRAPTDQDRQLYDAFETLRAEGLPVVYAWVKEDGTCQLRLADGASSAEEARAHSRIQELLAAPYTPPAPIVVHNLQDAIVVASRQPNNPSARKFLDARFDELQRLANQAAARAAPEAEENR